MPLRFYLRYRQDDDRIAFLHERLQTDWEVRQKAPGIPLAEEAEELAACDAALAMTWTAEFPPAPGLRLLQLPGAGFDRIDFAAESFRHAAGGDVAHDDLDWNDLHLPD